MSMASLRQWEWVYGILDPHVHELRTRLDGVDQDLGHAHDRKGGPDLHMGDLCLANLPVILVDDLLHLIEYRLGHVVHIDRWLVPSKEVDDDCFKFSSEYRLCPPHRSDSPRDDGVPRGEVRLPCGRALLVRDWRTGNHELQVHCHRYIRAPCRCPPTR